MQATIQSERVEMYIASNGQSFPGDRVSYLRDKLYLLNESQLNTAQATELKNPTVMLIISIFLGGLGVDRFMLGQVGIGVLKLLTGGVFGILWLIDVITMMKKTRQYNFDKIMMTLQAFGATGGDGAISTADSTDKNVLQYENVEATESSKTPQKFHQTADVAKDAGKRVAIAGEGAIAFLKVFVKNPIGAMRTSSLTFNEGLIFAAAQAVGLALTLMVLTFRGGNLPIVGPIFAAFNFGFGPSRIGLFFQAIFLCAALIVILVAVAMFFGKVVFRGNYTAENNFKSLFGYIVTTQVPLTIALVLSIAVGLIAPPLVLVLISAGVVAAVVFQSSVFASVFGLTEDKSAYATIATCSIQVLVVLVALLVIG